MMNEGCAGRRWANAAPVPFEEGCAEALFHQPNALAGRCERHTGPRSTMRDARRLSHEQEQTQIDQIKAHGGFHERLAFGCALGNQHSPNAVTRRSLSGAYSTSKSGTANDRFIHFRTFTPMTSDGSVRWKGGFLHCFSVGSLASLANARREAPSGSTCWRMSDRVNFYIDSRQGRRRLDSAAGRRCTLLKVFAVDVVHHGKLSDIPHVHCCLHDILQRGATSLEQQLEILNRLTRLARCVSG